MASLLIGAGSLSPASAADPVATKTTLALNADGTGTVQVTAEGVTPTSYVDLWIDSVWQKAYTLTDGKTDIDLGTQPHGDHQIYVRYRPDTTTRASDAITTWTAPGTIQYPTKTTLSLNADGTGTVEVTSEGTAPTNPVDLWIDDVWQKAYTLTAGKSAINLGTQPLGSHQIYVRYRANSTTKASDAITTWTAPGTVAVPTKTTLSLNADGTGTVQVTAEGGVTPTNKVDLWINSVWQKAYTLTDGKSAINLGTQPQGSHQIYVRYRPDTTTKVSDAITTWTAPGTIQQPTKTTLSLNADGTGTVQVTAEGGVTPTNKVDLWIDDVWQKAYTLTDGKSAVDLGTQPHGDHRITVRYRPDTTTQASQQTVVWTAPGTVAVPTKTTLTLNADGTGTIRVTSEGAAPTNYVDMWIGNTWQKAYALTNGEAAFKLGSFPGGDHQVHVRYRPNSTTLASSDTKTWAVTTDDQVPTTTTLSVLPDGNGTIRVTAENKIPTNPVDLWVDGQYKGVHTLTDGKASFALGSRPGGDLPVIARYRPSATDGASQAGAIWSVDTAPTPDPTDCGAPILKSDGEPWTCSFADDFSGTTLDRTKWAVQEVFGTGTNELACYVDSPENISVADGGLHLTVRKGEAKPCAGHQNVVTPYTSGMVTTFHKWSQQYGRFEARVKTTATTISGLHEAFWLWPDIRYPEGQEEWPANGEIDIAETYSNHADLVVPFLHSSLDALGSILTGSDANTTWGCRAPRGEYNTYTLEWSAERLEIFVNGNSCLVNTSGNAAFNKRYIMAFTQALGSQDNTVSADTPVPATMSIDYVRAWS
ncbi:glycoside hydrolase family 16 protein [Aeromicrobium sp.]|uniref:glycoside hydrolase family 16 protein n=1 Tax=Aeromicrobium sp. TaxID=1871063 RepID=UPI002FCA7F0D